MLENLAVRRAPLAARFACCALALLAGCSDRTARAEDAEASDLTPLERARAAFDGLGASTSEKRQEALERLRAEYESLLAELDARTEELRGQALERRDEALRELVAQCDGLERRLDELESSGGETWARLRGEVLTESSRLRSECERLLNGER